MITDFPKFPLNPVGLTEMLRTTVFASICGMWLVGTLEDLIVFFPDSVRECQQTTCTVTELMQPVTQIVKAAYSNQMV